MEIGYEHIDDAAAAALMLAERYAMESADRRSVPEFMTLLSQDPMDQLFYRSPLQNLGSPEGGQATFDTRGRPRGIVHNHPPGPRSDYFSGTDLSEAKRMGVPSYIAGLDRRGKLSSHRKFDPAKPSSTKAFRNAGVMEEQSRGDPFLAQFPIEEYLRLLEGRLPNLTKLQKKLEELRELQVGIE